ncbi:MAG: glycosyl hydrolase, partial [Gemmatimonadetes bacterium]|nr:glycosyl hydrolase [Gemmatimonadota bacterium]
MNARRPRPSFALVLCAFGALPGAGTAQTSAPGPTPAPTVAASTVSDADLRAVNFRLVGPFRGGRVTAVDGIPDQPFTFFFGSTGGGVWKTESGGQAWENVTDGWLDVGSIGAVEVADADPTILYVGTGSAAIRGNVSVGRGTWRSRDGGETWTPIGLRDAGQVASIRTHPDDPNTVWLAATGQPFGRNDERGVFKSTDGGDSWRKVLFHSDSVGAIDLALHPSDPEVLYAALWRGERKPWTMISGARTGGIYRSDDGGETWARLAGGLPGAGADEGGLSGKIGLATTPAAPDRVWAMVEAPDPRAGLYRSDDRGDTWTLVNDSYGMRSRPWYYTYVHADPVDPDVLWVLNSGLYRSGDAGLSFERVPMPHSDHHAMWTNPLRPEIVFNGNDGGATLSFDGGEHWSTQLNQPTAEFYNVAVDDDFPYRIYGSQQDNSTISVPTAATGRGITLQHWKSHGGCETGPVVPRPDTADIVYGGCFGGRFARADQATEQFRQIRPYPQAQDAMPENELRFRVQWNFPVELSPHDPMTMYYGSNVVHRSRNEGQSWDVVSPDLTTNDTTRFDMAGGPINNDVTGVEIWSALLAIQESPHAPGEIWTGSNDGRVMLTRDAGATWDEITPPDLPEPSTVNRIHLSTHRPGKAYVVAYRYRYDDWAPYVYRTTDWGRSWTRIADGSRGVPADWTSRSLVEDPVREGLLFLGTEFGLYTSLDDGESWRPLQRNLPRSPVTDLAVQERWGDLVVAMQGRSFWVLDDLSMLRGLTATTTSAPVHLY